jgi:chromatin structure-remodeling complex protein RSC7
MHYPKAMQPSHAKWIQIDDEAEANEGLANRHQEDTIFAPVKPVYSRNFMIVDTVYQSAPYSNLGVPGPDGDAHDLGFNGLSSVSDEIKAELPRECLEAFEAALAREQQWKERWSTEAADGMRNTPKIDKGVITL